MVGFALLVKELNDERMILDSFHVSQEYRHHGIGRELFDIAVKEGKKQALKSFIFPHAVQKRR